MGEFSKIVEEFHELEDAHEQRIKVLEICELCDLVGAIDLYVREKYDMTLADLNKMANKTAEAFKEGTR